MEFRFTPSPEDALAALRAVSMPRWGIFLFILLLALLFLVGIFLIDHDFAVVGWIWLASSAAIGVATYEIPRFQVRRAFRSNPSAQGEVSFNVSDDGTVTVFGTGRSELDWRAYTKYKETEALFLLYFSTHRYACIPKRVLSRDQVEELRALLHKNIQKR